MLWASVLVVVSTCLAFAINGLFPFSLPISLLSEKKYAFSYHVILLLYTIVLLFYLYGCIRLKLLQDLVNGGFLVVILLVLQFVPNNASGHDALSVTAMVLTGLLSLGIAQRIESRWLLYLALVLFISISLLFTQSLRVMGIVEGIILCSVLLLMNATGKMPTSLAVPNSFFSSAKVFNSYWKPGMGAGIAWGIACVFVTGIGGLAGRYSSGFASPLIAVVCAYAGYVAWSKDHSFWIRMFIIYGAYMVLLFGLHHAGLMRLHYAYTIPIALMMAFIFMIFFLVDVYLD